MFRTVGGRVQIDKKKAFCELCRQFPIGENDSITAKIMSAWDPYIRGQEPSVTREALSNCHGDWYEWILAIASLNARIIIQGHRYALLLPNISQFDVNTLYTEDVLTIIEDIKTKVEESADVNFITSNPDFVILESENTVGELQDTIEIDNIDEATLILLENMHSNFIGGVSLSELIGYISVKMSLRPDRRLQISHEGSLVKAIHAHIVTRKWLLDATPLSYYAITPNANDADKRALKTVATHSLITVTQKPQAAVDEVNNIDTYEQAFSFFSRILRH